DPGHPHTCVGEIVKTRDGKNYYNDDSGYWRMYVYFSHAYSMDIAESPEIFYTAGTSFGRFIMDMSDLPVDSLDYTIKNFHNTYSRYLDLEKAIESDVVDRAKLVTEEIEFVRKRKDSFDLINNALTTGRIPARITHNDTNLNNILFDKDTKEVVGIIDLDTTMPSSLLYDFGDSLRIGSNTACDDERDLSRVRCDLGFYGAFAKGFIEEVYPIITPAEIELLPYAPVIITMEDGIRFLADYINGDVYYTISRANHNFDRARCMFALAADMEKKMSSIKALLNGVISEIKDNK
ncbi:MAG: aminoglycoside phosphotransferase family protein, partial [Clostridia bacterium]|nr:aminoglycoside phosphotransferase family protein [Clostridia bacterium]